jgi:hypothetical protein
MDIINRINSTRYLGREFLTWLWYRSALQNGVFEISGAEGPLEVWFDAKLTLDAQGDIKESNVIKAENPTETSEAHAALINGKLVSDARLRVVSGQKQWTLSIKADTLGIGSVKIPALLSREDDDQLYERFMLIEEIEDSVDLLFQQFMALRLEDDAWRPEVQAIRAWVHGVNTA